MTQAIRRCLTLGVTLATVLALGAADLRAQGIPSVLTDKIHRGQGVIDILKDVSASSFEQYLDANGRLMLGIDVNEDASGNESARSQGIAIRQVELLITTTSGDFTFRDFYTSTAAMLLAAGATVAQQYSTVFGTGGSNSVTGGTSDFALSSFDDVIYLDSVSVTGTITGARLSVAFLETARNGNNTAESFFDFSNGFEDFAILGASEANALEAGNFGVADAPSTVSYSSIEIAPIPVPGAPAPPSLLLAGLAGVVAWKAWRG